MKTAPKMHDDGTVTYWSVYNQIWRRKALRVPDSELAAMSIRDRERVITHLRECTPERRWKV